MNFGEADKILTIFTEHLGKIKVMAKGIRKIKSHLAGALEPFILSDLQLHEGKTFYIVTGASIIDDFSLVHSELRKTGQAFLAGELVDSIVQEKEKSDEAFFLLLDFLKILNSKDELFVLDAFILKFINSTGFNPELKTCLHCKNKITPDDNFWDHEEGGLICNNCQTIYRHGFAIDNSDIKILRFVNEHSLFDCAKLKIDIESKKSIKKILRNYLLNITSKDLKSELFLKAIG